VNGNGGHSMAAISLCRDCAGSALGPSSGLPHLVRFHVVTRLVVFVIVRSVRQIRRSRPFSDLAVGPKLRVNFTLPPRIVYQVRLWRGTRPCIERGKHP
jgi:hypothetical protein